MMEAGSNLKKKGLQQRICQYCEASFPQQIELQLFMTHVRNCPDKKSKRGSKKNKNINKKKQNQYIFEKVPSNDSNTKYIWARYQKIKIQDLYNQKELSEYQTSKYHELKANLFQIKQQFFRRKLQKLRVSWTQGADIMKLSKSNILVDSLNQLKQVNIHKEIKVQFQDEKTTDAGGLLRQWIHMINNQIFQIELGIFKIGDVQEGVCYQLKWDQDICSQISKQWLNLFGLVLGKAIFQRIPMNGYLDRTILRQLTGHNPKIQDIYGYDKQIYRSWNFLKTASSEQILSLETYFVYNHQHDGEIKEIQLFQGGKQTKINGDNINLFLDLCLNSIISGKVQKSIKYIKQGIQRVFPIEFLQIFEPIELQMIIYGVSYIDLDDWKQNSQYKAPYNSEDKVIKWFWEIMKQFQQEQLQNMLKFCTGSTRTPISGFSKLESNRGNFSKFQIVRIEYNAENKYPKGITCFNRLELPNYPNKQQMQTILIAISKMNLDGVFGLD